MKRTITLISLALLILYSCKKEEGTGGEGKIKGVVYVKEYSITNNAFIKQVPALSEDVYIIYGSNSSVGDKVTTSNKGVYEFPYLLDGSYKIYVYSSDSLFVQKNKYAVMTDISIKNGNTVEADTLFIIKMVDQKTGNGLISGKVFYKEYDNEFKYFQRISPASAIDIYISYLNDSLELNKSRTSFNGSFLFNNLANDSYKIYVFQDDTSKVLKTVCKTISPLNLTNEQKLNLDTIFIFKGLGVDKGNATISGKVWLINYKANGIDQKDGVVLAQDYDVFLVYDNHIVYDLDTKTGQDGVFSFPNLIKGKYTVYLYSEKEDQFGNLTGSTQKVTHKKNITITSDKQSFFITDTVKVF
jgi:hypothetical protein